MEVTPDTSIHHVSQFGTPDRPKSEADWDAWERLGRPRTLPIRHPQTEEEWEEWERQRVRADD